MLEFQNVVVDLGRLNYTVREGKRREYEVGTNIEIGCSYQKIKGEARVILLIECRLADVPFDVINYEHDPKCRNWEGLHNELKVHYPNITRESIVTCIGFIPLYIRKEE
jgi:hypothetical protein